MSKNQISENPTNNTEVNLKQAVKKQPVLKTSNSGKKVKSPKKKRILIYSLASVVLAGLVTFLLCGLLIKSYSIDPSVQIADVALNEEVDDSNIYVIRKNLFGEEKILVTEDMIVESDDTSTPGKKQMKIKVGNQIFTVEFFVKFRVEFVVDSVVIKTQLVLNASEIEVPTDFNIPEGMLFASWNIEIPTELTTNLRIEAVFINLDSNVPNLGYYSATYGDKLSSITLPSNEYGSWKFPDSSLTVGNAGTNTFKVVFESQYEYLNGREGTVQIGVAKKQVNFTIIKDSFIYDGLSHKPEYTWDADCEVSLTFYGSQNPTEIGTYYYDLNVEDPNYVGSYSGQLNITQPEIVITVNDITITYGESIPALTWTVTSKTETGEVVEIDGSFLNIRQVAPTVVYAGTYESYLTVDYNFSEFKNVTIINGDLIIEKADYNLDDEHINFISSSLSGCYTDKLDTVLFPTIPTGSWQWEDDSIVIDTANKFSAVANFIPHNNNYNEVRGVELEFTVNAKEVQIVFGNTSFIYSESDIHSVSYQIFNGDVELIEGVDVTVNLSGDVNKASASNFNSETGEYIPYTLIVTIDSTDGRYTGSDLTNWVIEKKTPTADFSTVFEANWRQSLSDIKLPEHYSWVSPETVLEEINTNNELKFKAIYDLNDYDSNSVNYEVVEGYFTVNVKKLVATVNGLPEQNTFNVVYSGNEFVVENITIGHNEESVLSYEFYTVTQDTSMGERLDSIVDVGSYVLILTFSETEHYAGVTVEAYVNITAAKVSAPDTLTAVYEDTLEDLLPQLPETTLGTWSFAEAMDTVLGDAGHSYKYNLVFTSNNDNYASYTKEITVTVVKKELQFTVTQNEFLFDGLEHEVIYEIKDASGKVYTGLTVESNIDPMVNAFDEVKSVRLVIVSNNYSGTVETTFKINKIVVTAPTADTTRYVYNGSDQTYQLATNEYYTISNNVAKEPGEYVVIVGLNDRNNYVWTDGTNEQLRYTFVINKAVYDMSNVTWGYDSQNPFVYTGAKHTVELVGLPDGVSANYQDNSKVDAGTYTATATLVYDKVRYEAPSAIGSLEWEITKATLDINWTYQDSYIFGTTLMAPTATVTLFDDSILDLIVTTDREFLDAGEYTFTASLPVEYQVNYLLNSEQTSITVNIEKESIDMNGVRWDYTEALIYNGELQTVQLINLPEYVKPIYSNNSFTEVGTYTATVRFECDDNHSLDLESLTLEWKIEKATLDVVWEVEPHYVYGAITNLPKAYVYTFESEEKLYLEVSTDREFYAAGEYTFTASLPVENRANYILNSDTNTKEVTIGKALFDMSKVSWNYTTPFEFDFKEHKVEVTGLPEGLTPVYTNNVKVNAGTYNATVTFTYDKANYEAPTEVAPLEWVILPHEVLVDWVIGNYTYTGSELSYPLASITYGDETLELVVTPNKEFKNAGSYIFTATTTNGNYKLSNEVATVTVDQAAYDLREVVWNYNNTPYVYTSLPHKVYLENLPSTITLEYSNAEKVAAGTYTATVIEINYDTVNYVYPEELLTKTLEWSIDKALVDVNWIVDEYTYGEVSSTPKATFDKVEGGAEYLTVTSDREFLAAGNYTFTASLPSSYEANYILNEATTTRVVNIMKASFNMENVKWDYKEAFTYDLTTHEVEVTGLPDGLTPVHVNNSAKDAGKYVATVTFTYDEDNFNAPAAVMPLEWEILAASVEVKWVVPTYIYNKEVQNYPTASITYQVGSNKETIVLDVKTDKEFMVVDSYIFVASTTNTNYILTNNNQTVEIKPAIVTVPVVLAKQYTGELQKSGLVDNELYKVVSDDGGIELGTYHVTVELQDSDNYIWSEKGLGGEYTATMVVSYEISATVNSWNSVPSVESSFVYNPTSNVVVNKGEAEFGNSDAIVYYKTYGSDEEYTTVKPVNVGKYVAKVVIAKTEEYSELVYNDLVFEIVPCQITEPAEINTPFFYDESEQTYNLAVLEGIYEVKNNVAKDHGTYIVTVSLIDKDNYVWETSLDSDDLTYTFVIQKGTYNPTIPTPTAPYGTSLKDVTLNATDGVWTWNNINDKVGNKGSQTHLAKFVPTDTNYNECIDVEIIIDVTQAQTVITDLSISSWVYNETAVDPQANTNFGHVYFKYSNEENGTYVSTVPTDAGSYFVKAFVDETDNYSSATSEAVAFEIYKATPTVVWPTTEKLTMEWGNSLSSLDINSSFEFVDVNIYELYNTPGRYQVKIKYISSDSNYSDLENTVTVIVTKKVATIEYIGSESFDYDVNNTNGFELTYKTNSTAEVTWYAQYTSFLDNAQPVGKGQIIDAGTYVVTAICEENELYYEGNLKTTIVVNKHEEVIADVVEAEYNDSLSQLVVPTSNYGTWTYEAKTSTFSLRSTSDLVFDELEDVIIYAVFTPHSQYINNFATIRKEITVKVEKRTLNIEIDNSFEDKVGFIYDSTEKLATYKVYDKDGTLLTDEQLALLGVTITGNEGLINVGSKVVTLNVNGTYYRGLKSFTLEVERANYDLSEVMLNDDALTYTGSAQSVSLINLPASITITEYSGNTATTIGDYTLSVVSFTYDSHNYYEPTFDEYNWKIVESAVSVSWENVSYTYNPEGQTLPKAYITLVTGETIELHVEPNDTFLNADDYVMTASITDEMLEENNLLANYTLSNNTKPYTIAKATPTTLFGTALDGEYVYGTKLSKITLPTGYTWNNQNESISVIGFGEYAATLAETANYLSATGVIKVEGIRREQELTIANNISFDYTSSNILLSILKADELGTAHVRLNHNEEFTYTAKYYTDSERSNEVSYMRNAGTYYVTLTVNQTATYNSATANFTVVVNTIAPNVARPSVSELTFVYGTTLNSELLNATLIRDVEGNWIVTEQVLTTLGANFINLTFDPTDPNYHDLEFTNVEISVSTIETTVIPAEHLQNGTPVEYTSSPFVLRNWFSTNRPEGVAAHIEFTINGTSGTQITDAGTYTINYMVTAEGAYSSAEGTVTVTISKSDDYTVSNTSSLTATYGETLSQYTSSLPNDNSIPGSYHWKVNGELVDGTSVRVGNATTGTNKNTFTAVFVPTNTNYVSKEVTVSFTVNRATITFENIVSTFDYNGTTQYVTYTLSGVISGDANPEVTGNTGRTDAGTTVVTLSVDTVNYVGQSSAINLTINAVAPTLSIPAQTVYEDRLPDDYGLTTNATATYNGSKVDGSFTYSDSQITMGTNSTSATKTVNVDVTFTPNSSNYTSQTGTMVVTINAVAKNDNYYFGTVEQALNSTSAGVVTVIPGTNPIIRTNAEVKNDVTLFIPYQDGLSTTDLTIENYAQAVYYSGNQGYSINNPQDGTAYVSGGVEDSGEFATEYPDRLKSTLTIATKLDGDGNVIPTILTNNGIIEISGQLSAGGGGISSSGHTYGLYSKISLDEKAQIINNNKILCFGYIDEISVNNGSLIDITATGTIYMPYVVRDFRGGSYSYAVYSKRSEKLTVPFNQYELRNVSAKVIYNHGAQLIGWGNLWASSKHNFTEVKLIGTTSSYFIETSNSYSTIEALYNKSTEVLDIDLYGGAKLNSMQLKINAGFGSPVDINTNEYYECLSWRFDISLNKNSSQTSNAIFTMPGKYKLLPGAKFTVNEGTELTIGSLAIYKKWIDTCEVGSKYGDGAELAPAEFTVNGIVNATNLAGTVLNGRINSAQLNISTGSSITTYETTGAVSGSLMLAKVAFKAINNTLNLHLYKNGNVDTRTSYVGAGNYISLNGGWYSTSGKIYYDGNGGSFNLSESEEFEITTSGYEIKDADIPSSKPTRQYYTFTKWYYDAGLTQEVKVGDVIYAGVTFYAGWTPDEFTIEYVDKYYSENDYTDVPSTPNNITSFTYETFEFFSETKPKNGDLVFGGFYLDEACTSKLELFDGTILAGKLAGNITKVYLYWYPKDTASYTITYSNPKNDIEDYTNAHSIEKSSFVIYETPDWDKQSLPSFNAADSDKFYEWYFGGWYLNESFTGDAVTKIDSSLFGTDENGNPILTCTLYAKWIKKNSVTFNVKEYGASSNLLEDYIIYYKPSTVSDVVLDTSKFAEYVPSGSVALATRKSNNTDFLIGNSLSTSGYSAEEVIEIVIRKLVTISFSVAQVTDCEFTANVTINNGYFYDLSSNTINKTAVPVSENTSSSIVMLEGTSFTFTATGKVKSNRNLTDTKSITKIADDDASYAANATISYKYVIFAQSITVSIS